MTQHQPQIGVRIILRSFLHLRHTCTGLAANLKIKVLTKEQRSEHPIHGRQSWPRPNKENRTQFLVQFQIASVQPA